MSSKTRYLQLLGSIPGGGVDAAEVERIVKEYLTAHPPTGSGDLPGVTDEDDGKFLQVQNGAWVASELPSYDGEYVVTPSVDSDQTLQTAQKLMDADVKVEKIPYAEVTNTANGVTVTIA